MTQGEIEKLTVKVSNIFSELEVRIMTDIVRRIKENGFASASVDWQIIKATAVGNGRGRYPWMDPERITGNGCRDGQDIF